MGGLEILTDATSNESCAKTLTHATDKSTVSLMSLMIKYPISPSPTPRNAAALLSIKGPYMRLIPRRLVLLAALCTALASARTIDLDSATLADLNAAFNSGALTSEKLVQLCLARIHAYDHQGPALNAVMFLNPKALETARALDAERKAKGPRSPLHGIPVVLKDNYNTADMPTTGGSVLLEGSIPPADAFLVKKLRDAGAIILAKVNM